MKLLRILSISALALFSGSIAAEQSLVQFQQKPALELSQSEIDEGIVNKYLITIDPEVIYQNAKVGPSRPNQKRIINSSSDFLLLPSTNGFKLSTSIQLESNYFGNYVEGVDTFSGTITGDETSSFVFSIENNQLSGQVLLSNYLINIKYDSKLNSHLLSLIDLHKMPRDLNKRKVLKSNIDSNGTNGEILFGGGTQSAMSSYDQGNIRILFYYTPHVASRNNIGSMIGNILSELNTSIDLSRINPDIDFTLASSIQLGGNLTNLCKDEIEARASANPRQFPFNNLNAHLTQHTADIVLIIATTESYPRCETSYPHYYLQRFGGQASGVFTEAQPIAITMDTYALGDLTAVHEIGHVIGGNHEIENEEWCIANNRDPCFVSGDGTPVYARGLVSATENWQTIMGGYWGCDFNLQPIPQACIRLNRWSNPSINYQGEATGLAGESDMASALEITAPIVSGWTSYPTAAPTSAPTISSDFGCNPVSWGFISGSTHYQVFKSTSSSFPGGGNRVGLTTFPSFFVNIPFGQTQYVRVRACNGNGCGPYSNTLSVTNDLSCT